MISIKIICVFALLIFISLDATSQINSNQLQQFFSETRFTNKAGLKYTDEVKQFYSLNNFQKVWFQNEQAPLRNNLLNILEQSDNYGLEQRDYQFNFISSLRNNHIHLLNTEDSLLAEVQFTDALVHFLNDISYGNTIPALGYDGLKYKPGCINIPSAIKDFLSHKNTQLLITRVSPILPEITLIENKIRWLNAIIKENEFTEVKITSKKVNNSNLQLIIKLYQLGIIENKNTTLADSTIKIKLKEAQRQFNLLPDGNLRTTILSELNKPVMVRLLQLKFALNYYRWLNCITVKQSVIVVNIPASYLKVYEYNNVILEMRMIVGKTSTPTPTLSSTVSEVILYPYWHVPYDIATKELLPIIKRNPGYINSGNYQVLNRSGKIVDPYSINWHSLSRSYFPYLIRQSTGCDNALGLLKLNFYNPFSVYLHDTPGKNLFSLNKRFFSHGCMRMQKPMELGHLVLKNNKIAIDTLEQKGCLRNQSPVTVRADEKIPVIVWYNPAGIDSTGRVIYYEDVYNKFNWMK